MDRQGLLRQILFLTSAEVQDCYGVSSLAVFRPPASEKRMRSPNAPPPPPPPTPPPPNHPPPTPPTPPPPPPPPPILKPWATGLRLQDHGSNRVFTFGSPFSLKFYRCLTAPLCTQTITFSPFFLWRYTQFKFPSKSGPFFLFFICSPSSSDP